MYLKHFGFEYEPFNITPDSRFLFSSRRHSEAMASLLYGIEQRKGFIALTGEIGAGKTTICRALLKSLDRENVRLALIFNPQLNDVELLQEICREYGLPSDGTSKREMLEALNTFLLSEYEKGNNCVLLIDESQRLSPDALEQVRLLSNLELETAKLIQIALVGQPELNDMLALPELEQLDQRITVRYHIDPLEPEEAAKYIRHRLDVAGEGNARASFDRKALRQIHSFSRGIPRKINVICDRCLLVAFVEGAHEITGKHVSKALEEVKGRSSKRPRPAPEVGESVSDKEPNSEQARGGGLLVAASVVAGCSVIAFAMLANRDVPEPRSTETTVAAAVTPAFGDERLESPGPDSAEQRIQEELPATPDVESLAGPSPDELATSSVVEELENSPAEPVSDEQQAVASEPEPETVPAAVQDVVGDAEEAPVLEVAGPSETDPVPAADAQTTEESDLVSQEETVAVRVAEPVHEPVVAASLWRYDSDGILRVPTGDSSYAAAILTWVNLSLGEKLPDGELDALGSLSREALSGLRLTEGTPPLHLQRASLPAVPSLLTPDEMPALVQVDLLTEDFGPWIVILGRTDDTFTAADPLRGRVDISEPELSEHLAAIILPYSDPEGITGLGPSSSGERVIALQRILGACGFLKTNPTGDFDTQTRNALLAFRAKHDLPGEEHVDSELALVLLSRFREGASAQ